MFEIGQQVVCIRECAGSGGPGYGDEILPRVGQVYTIRGFEPAMDPVGLLFEEIRNLVRAYSTIPSMVTKEMENPFRPDFFRPVRKTDIGIFTEMLVPVTPKKLAPLDAG